MDFVQVGNVENVKAEESVGVNIPVDWLVSCEGQVFTPTLGGDTDVLKRSFQSGKLSYIRHRPVGSVYTQYQMPFQWGNWKSFANSPFTFRTCTFSLVIYQADLEVVVGSITVSKGEKLRCVLTDFDLDTMKKKKKSKCFQ